MHPDLRTIRIHPNFWYPVARASELAHEAIRPVLFAGEAIALVRTASGALFAVENRCAHRQMPLHLGVVSGEHLQCGYHGWCYNMSGRLVRIPCLADSGTIPSEARGVRLYPCREAYGLIFIFPGMPDQAERAALPEIPTWSSSEYSTMYFSREVRCHYSFMHENLMDMNHQFLHRRLMGVFQPKLLAHRAGGTWTEAQYRFEASKPHIGANFMVLGGTVHATGTGRDYDLMTIRTDYPYQTLDLLRAHADTPAIRLWAAYVPIDAEQRRNRSFGLLMIRRPKIPGLLAFLWPVIRHFAESVFTEDRQAVEAEQAAHDAQGADLNCEISPVLIELRRVLEQCGIAPNAKASCSAGTS